jgi:hypothetical protein
VKIEILTDYPHVEKKSGGSKISGQSRFEIA